MREAPEGGGRVLLAIGLSMAGAGFTRVLTALAGALSDRYEIHWFGLCRPGADAVAVAGVQADNCFFKPHEFQASAQLRRLIARIEPGAILLLGQPPWLRPLIETARAARPSCPIVLYAPIEGRLTDAAWLEPLGLVDRLILYTEHARRSVAALAAESPTGSLGLPPIDVLPHGVDAQTFRPLARSPGGGEPEMTLADLRRLLFPDRPDLAEAFIVLNANFPYPRKRIDLTIEGFALFAADKPPNVRLCLHHVRLDRYQRGKLEAMAKAVGIGERLILNALNPKSEPIADAQLNLLYNACDVGITTAMGEGFGLVSFEHAATGAPQIAPNHTAFTEHWTGAAQMVPVAGQSRLWYEYADMDVVAPADVADALEALYRDAAHRRRMGEAAFARATSTTYRWNNIADRLTEILGPYIAVGPAAT
jgi:D-inositol-3-phosphate glycosyltransferase